MKFEILEIRTPDDLTKIVYAFKTLQNVGAKSISVKEVQSEPIPIYVAIVEFDHGTEVHAAFDPIDAVARVAEDWCGGLDSSNELTSTGRR